MKIYLGMAGLLSLALVGHAFGSTPNTLDPATTGPPGAISGIAGFASGISQVPAFNTAINVTNWVLCTNQKSAETIITAREGEDGVNAAEKAYTTLVDAKTCGLFATLRVKLEKSFAEASDGNFDPSLYRAAIQIKKDSPDTDWPDGFVFDGDILAQ